MQSMPENKAQLAPHHKQAHAIELPFLLITPKLVIRPLIGEDRDKMLVAIQESIKDLKMCLPWSEEQPTQNDIEKICNDFYAESLKGSAYHMAIFRNEEFMGMCSYNNYTERTNTSDIGYWSAWCPISTAIVVSSCTASHKAQDSSTLSAKKTDTLESSITL